MAATGAPGGGRGGDASVGAARHDGLVLGDGSMWELTTQTGITVTVSDAQPTPPYADTAEFSATLGPAHTLVVLTPTLVDALDLTTTLVRLGP